MFDTAAVTIVPMGLPEPRLAFSADLPFTGTGEIEPLRYRVLAGYPALKWFWDEREFGPGSTPYLSVGTKLQVRWSLPMSRETIRAIDDDRLTRLGDGSVTNRSSLQFSAQVTYSWREGKTGKSDSRTIQLAAQMSSDDWLRALGVFGLDEFVVFEVPVRRLESTVAVMRFLSLAQASFREGRNDNAVVEVRRAVESLVGPERKYAEFCARIHPGPERTAQREALSGMLKALAELRNAGAHGHEDPTITRADALLGLTVGIAIARHVGAAAEN